MTLDDSQRIPGADPALHSNDRVVRAFAPAHVSCVFLPYRSDDPSKSGSLGMGFTLDKGVCVTVKRSDTFALSLSGHPARMPTVDCVVAELAQLPVSIAVETDVPIGSGFGVSGAAALATAFALDRLFGTRLPAEQLALIAHESEVRNGTGLGDVSGQYNGGLTVRSVRGEPLKAVRIKLDKREIYYKVYGGIDTKCVITDERRVERIRSAGEFALARLLDLREKSLESLTEIAKMFATESGLLSSERALCDIEAIEQAGGRASMIMLGEAVYSTIPWPGYERASIIDEGVHIL